MSTIIVEGRPDKDVAVPLRDDTMAFIRANRKLSKDAKDRIPWKNAARLMKIRV